ncbi:MAG: tetratricopeptide repeat protein [Paludibacter sp.]|nr:tetratricopeptide repeat protein [Paludibacter sp.]
MYKVLIIFVFVSTSIFSQQKDCVSVDSISYAYFMSGNWDELISVGKKALNNKIDYKYLRQRIGYAYFMKGDYYNSIIHYEKSLEFDPVDEISLYYLHYAGLYSGNISLARYYAGELPETTQNMLKEKSFRPVNIVDFEYNKKISNYALRSNPDYFRLGINSQLGYRFNLYQSVSRYNQIAEWTTAIEQDEYFALLNWTALSRTNLSLGYHFVNSKVKTETDSIAYPGNIWFGKINQSFHRFDIAFSTSVFNNEFVQTTQIGTQIGVALPGKRSPYLKSSLYNINEDNYNRIVFSQYAGLYAAKKIWAEASVTIGNLNNYVDLNGLYFYNSLDPTTFRIGGSVFWYLHPHITIYSNYTYDIKQVVQTLFNYNQHSITGGIIWKL